MFSSFGVEPHKIIVISLARYILSGLLTGATGLSLALMEARNHKKLLKFKSPLFFTKEYFKEKIEKEHLLK